MTYKDMGSVRISTTREKIVFLSKFFTSPSFRENTGYPWVEWVLKSNWGKIRQEIEKSEEMLSVLWKSANGGKVTSQEKKLAKAQLLEIARLVPALAIFLLPGGMILLPLLARALPWELLPSSFRKETLPTPTTTTMPTEGPLQPVSEGK